MASTLVINSPAPRRASFDPPRQCVAEELQPPRGSTGQLWDILRGSTGIIGAANAFLQQRTFKSQENILESAGSSTSSIKQSSPVLYRADKYEFVIPRSRSFHHQVSIHSDTDVLGQLDISQYMSGVAAHEMSKMKLGEMKFSLGYKSGKLKVILKSVEVFLKPSPSVVGCNWVCEPIIYMDVLPAPKKPTELLYGAETLVCLREEDVEEKTVRFTVYDSRRKNTKLPIGHVLLTLREIKNIHSLNIHSKKINFYSQPAGFNKGNLQISLSWLVSSQKLDVKIGTACNLKSPYGVEGKEHFVKITVFLCGKKEKSFKTCTRRAQPDINFREKFTIPISSSQLKDSSLLFSLYMKHTSKKMLAGKILTGKTVIGPYMMHGERCLSQWEKIITNPLEELSETHTLYI